MGWANKMHKKHQTTKIVNQIMESKEWKEAKKKDQEQAVFNAFLRLSFFACEYLEEKHGYKKKGLQRFLKYMVELMDEPKDDQQYFIDAEKYYKEELGLDVMKELGLAIRSDDDDTQTEEKEL